VVGTTQGEVPRQTAFFVRPQFAGAVFQAQNLALSSFNPQRVLSTGALVHESGGRAFLLDCPTGMPMMDYAHREKAYLEIMGSVISNIPESHFFAATQGTESEVGLRGLVHNGRAIPDRILSLASFPSPE